MFVADFETCDSDRIYKTDIKTGQEIKDQRVWLAGHKNLETMKTEYFYSIDDFMEDILARKDNVNTEYAFHNLKYDGSYIVPYLFKNGYQVTQNKPQPKQFSVLVDSRNAWYSITIQVTAKRRVLLWDSAKLFPCALEYLPDVYSTPSRKIIEDSDFYERYRPIGYKANKEELWYLENDLAVVAEALNKHIELYGLRFKKTQASQSFYNFEQSFKAWRFRFPALTIEEDKAIRRAYWGGISHVASDKQGIDLYDIGVMDINSSYPHKAATSKLPYGHSVYEFGEGKHPDMSKFWVAECLIEFKLKPNCLPCIPSKAITEGRPLEYDKWMDDSEGIVRLTLSNIDYITIQMSYEIKVWRWCWSIHWAWKTHVEVAKFVYKNNEIKVKYSKLAKKTNDAHKKAEYNTMRNRAKTDNNGFYGKFGEEVIKEGKTPYYDEVDEDVLWKIDRIEEQSENKRKYLPVAIAITAWGRQQLVIAFNLLGKYSIYTDTDSLHYLKEGQPILDKAIKDGIIEMDNENLGAWKHEGDFKKGRYLRAKCYMEETYNGKIEATVAGLPADKHSGQFSKSRSCLTWDNFRIGTRIPPEETNKLRTIRTRTGNKLVPTDFTIKEKLSIFH